MSMRLAFVLISTCGMFSRADQASRCSLQDMHGSGQDHLSLLRVHVSDDASPHPMQKNMTVLAEAPSKGNESMRRNTSSTIRSNFSSHYDTKISSFAAQGASQTPDELADDNLIDALHQVIDHRTTYTRHINGANANSTGGPCPGCSGCTCQSTHPSVKSSVRFCQLWEMEGLAVQQYCLSAAALVGHQTSVCSTLNANHFDECNEQNSELVIANEFMETVFGGASRSANGNWHCECQQSATATTTATTTTATETTTAAATTTR
eukprot:gnl/TRDRNA2_/TRDRNA2_185038_c0_seq1.p1 gnl/TRDRNA2_/TRDRNA2_185038_c0~~gnl/TRDRNA2_/TRDRNA2_185038_c0_seq1.p1  ORF type:complete len:264 (-),score=17.05 gnl/TRDRNA2_/TRDRNA2_185038_c0_seq1:149-940(-)